MRSVLSIPGLLRRTSSRLATLMARGAAEANAGAAKRGLAQALVGRVVRGVEGRTGALTIPAPPPVEATTAAV